MLNLMLFIGLHMLFCPLQRGLGAPGREPVVTEDEQKKMMAYYYKKQEEFKVCTVKHAYNEVPGTANLSSL